MGATRIDQPELTSFLALSEYLADYADFLRSLGRFERAAQLPQSSEEWNALAETAHEVLTDENLAVIEGVFKQLPSALTRAADASTLSAREKIDLGDFLDLLGTALRRAVEA